MEPNKNEITFEVMVMYSEVLEKAIEQHNNFNEADFRIVEVIDDEVIFCKIGVSKYTLQIYLISSQVICKNILCVKMVK